MTIGFWFIRTISIFRLLSDWCQVQYLMQLWGGIAGGNIDFEVMLNRKGEVIRSSVLNIGRWCFFIYAETLKRCWISSSGQLHQSAHSSQDVFKLSLLCVHSSKSIRTWFNLIKLVSNHQGRNGWKTSKSGEPVFWILDFSNTKMI